MLNCLKQWASGWDQARLPNSIRWCCLLDQSAVWENLSSPVNRWQKYLNPLHSSMPRAIAHLANPLLCLWLQKFHQVLFAGKRRHRKDVCVYPQKVWVHSRKFGCTPGCLSAPQEVWVHSRMFGCTPEVCVYPSMFECTPGCLGALKVWCTPGCLVYHRMVGCTQGWLGAPQNIWVHLGRQKFIPEKQQLGKYWVRSSGICLCYPPAWLSSHRHHHF